MIVRRATEDDLDAVAAMVDDMVKGHPAEQEQRPRADLLSAYFSDRPLAHLLVASRDSEVIGMGQWTLIYDMFWSKLGGHGEWLYVRPEHRGHGVAAAIVAEICKEIHTAGGEFLRGGGDEPHITQLYNRATKGALASVHYVGGKAFVELADLAGKSLRDIVRGLPAPEINHSEA